MGRHDKLAVPSPQNCIFNSLIKAHLVVRNLPVFISCEPLWMLLERQHAQSLLGIFQKPLGMDKGVSLGKTGWEVFIAFQVFGLKKKKIKIN